jgi:hypothetical protein
LKIELTIPDSIKYDEQSLINFRAFLQAMLNRRMVGTLRYSAKADRRQKYLTRLTRELKAYKESQNFEQLLNIANYCFLESEAPQRGKINWNPAAESVTREE